MSASSLKEARLREAFAFYNVFLWFLRDPWGHEILHVEMALEHLEIPRLEEPLIAWSSTP